MTISKPHRCDFCSGTVRQVIADREPIMVRGGSVFVQGFEIGKCDRCGHAYFPVDLIKRAERAAEHPDQVERAVSIPILAA